MEQIDLNMGIYIEVLNNHHSMMRMGRINKPKQYTDLQSIFIEIVRWENQYKNFYENYNKTYKE